MAQSSRLTKEEIKEDRFIEAVLKSLEFLKKNFKTIIIALAVVIVGIFGTWTYRRHQQDQRAEASFALVKVIEKYQEAEQDSLNAEKANDSNDKFQAIATDFQTIVREYSGTSFADKALYNYAKTLYYQGNYDGAKIQFQSVIDSQPEDEILVLYAQKAIGDCYAQESKYQEAIAAYQSDKYPLTPKIPGAVLDFVLANAKFSQALCYEKLGQPDEALPLYKDLVQLFNDNLKKAIQQKSLEFIPEAKTVISEFPQPLVVSNAQALEDQGSFDDAFVAYVETIHRYKVDGDIHGGLNKELRERIRNFETKANEFLKNLRDARRYESEARRSTALYYYDQSVGLDFAPSRNLYEKAILYRNVIESAQK